MKTIDELRFWCQKVLPLTYDDSLSYYEVLCKLTAKLNELVQTNNTLPAFIQTLIDAKLTTDKIAESILTLTKYPWLQSDTDRAAYKDRVLTCLASFLEAQTASDCVEGNSPKAVYKYNTNNGYMGIMGRYLDFVTDATLEIDGVTYPVAYMDCSVFASLITKGHTYESSPYGYALGNTDIDKKLLLMKSLENGTPKTMPYTFDFLNEINADKMAYILYKAGSVYTEWNPADVGDSFANAETGDIVFRGNSTCKFNNIDHIGVYVKTLDELQDHASAGVTFKPLGSYGNNGYIVHFSGATVGDYGNCLKIQAVEDWSITGEARYFWNRAVSCALTSNKSRCMSTDEIKCYDYDLIVAQEVAVESGVNIYTIAKMISHIPGGWLFRSGDDLNDFKIDGTYRCGTSAILNTLLSKPDTLNALFTLKCVGFNSSGTSGMQILYPSYAVTTAFQRNLRSNGEWSAWKRITTEDIS